LQLVKQLLHSKALSSSTVSSSNCTASAVQGLSDRGCEVLLYYWLLQLVMLREEQQGAA
jgi:hypothetical protein